MVKTMATPARITVLGQIHRMQDVPDPVLCEECLAGNDEAWSALLERYQSLIYSIPLSFHLSPEEAADIFQAVALDLFTDLETVRNQEKLGNWLFSVTRHRCIRHKESVLADPSRRVDVERIGGFPDPRLTTEELLGQVQEAGLLREAVAELPPRCRNLVEWLFYSDPAPSYEDVARRLGVAKNSVGFIRDRCLSKLRLLVEGRGLSFGRSHLAP